MSSQSHFGGEGDGRIELSSWCHYIFIYTIYIIYSIYIYIYISVYIYIYIYVYIYIYNEVIYHVPQFMSCLPQNHFGDNRKGTFFSWSCFHDLYLRITGWTNTVFVRYSEFHDKWFLEIQLTSVFYVVLWKCVFVLVSTFW